MISKYKNDIDIHQHSVGKERRFELIRDILNNSDFLPNTITYKDIDEEFKRFVSEELCIISPEGKEFPTMTLFSNQRFSEYSQSWNYTDINNNLLLNFKTISRENNPQYGKIQNGYWNIPGENRFYTMIRKKVLDDNGTESFLDLKMRQPMAIDFTYKVSIFTTNYNLINEFNLLVNRKFEARQCYIRPNKHFMPMTLEGISDESQYNINDRQFYGQTYDIKVMGYIITEDDYKVEQIPLKRGFNIGLMKNSKHKPIVEISECEEPYNPLYNQPVTLSIIFPEGCTKSDVTFTIDSDFISNSVSTTNMMRKYKVYVNGDEIDISKDLNLKNGDEVRIIIYKKINKKESILTYNGYNPNVIYNEELDEPESELDITQTQENIEINIE